MRALRSTNHHQGQGLLLPVLDHHPRHIAAWIPCGGCDDFFCTLHGTHAYDCECPPIEEWDADPYADD